METKETKINVNLNIDGNGDYKINTGIKFFDHMLELFSRHARFDLKVTCKGDINVDYHHTVEDVGIVLGQAFREDTEERCTASCVVLAFCRDSCRDAFSLP